MLEAYKVLNMNYAPMSPRAAALACYMAKGLARKARAHQVQKDMWVCNGFSIATVIENFDSELFPDFPAIKVTFAGMPFEAVNTMREDWLELLDENDNVLVRVERLPIPAGYEMKNLGGYNAS